MLENMNTNSVAMSTGNARVQMSAAGVRRSATSVALKVLPTTAS